MPRLRTKQESFRVQVAAEVLEFRSLLSAGAALAGHAAHAAAHALAAQPAAHSVLPQTAVSVTVSQPGSSHNSLGSVTMTPVTLKQGGHVTLHVTTEDNTATAVIKGKITDWSVGGIDTTIHLVPAGKLTVKNNSGHTVATAKAQKTEPLTLSVVNSTLDFVQLDLNFVSSVKPPFLFHLTASIG